MKKKKTINKFKLKGKKVIIRCDFNVPIKQGVIVDDNRIKMSLETINYALKKQAKVILMSHLGKVKTNSDKEINTLKPVSNRLSELLKKEVKFCPITKGLELENIINNMVNGDVLLIENTRFEDVDLNKESNCDEELSSYWANLGDIFINDAYGTAHRSHASNVGIATKIPSGIGFLMEKEINTLDKFIHNPKKPYVVILGGAKIEDKIAMIQNLVNIADKILIGGGMVFTFLKAKDIMIGKSIVALEHVDLCKKLLSEYPDKIVLPVDILTGENYDPSTNIRVSNLDQIRDNEMGMDIGPETIKLYKTIIDSAKQIFWNGPMGVYEFPKFANGTRELIQSVANSYTINVIAGGDLGAVVNNMNLQHKIFHISTGGGATLEYLEGKSLPGIEVIGDK